MSSIKQFVNQHKGKVLIGTATVATQVMTASAAIDANWTDGISAAGSILTTSISVFQTPPLVYFVGLVAAITGLKAVGYLIRKFM